MKKWTGDEIRKVVRLAGDGKNATDIATILGRPKVSVDYITRNVLRDVQTMDDLSKLILLRYEPDQKKNKVSVIINQLLEVPQEILNKKIRVTFFEDDPLHFGADTLSMTYARGDRIPSEWVEIRSTGRTKGTTAQELLTLLVALPMDVQQYPLIYNTGEIKEDSYRFIAIALNVTNKCVEIVSS